jgi:hypothetical protein
MSKRGRVSRHSKYVRGHYPVFENGEWTGVSKTVAGYAFDVVNGELTIDADGDKTAILRSGELVQVE